MGKRLGKYLEAAQQVAGNARQSIYEAPLGTKIATGLFIADLFIAPTLAIRTHPDSEKDVTPSPNIINEPSLGNLNERLYQDPNSSIRLAPHAGKIVARKVEILPAGN